MKAKPAAATAENFLGKKIVKTFVLQGAIIAAWLAISGSAWAQQAVQTESASAVPDSGKTAQPAVPNTVPGVAASAVPQRENIPAPGADSPGNPNADKAPMQAQELADLVPKDSSQPRAADISRGNASSPYHYNKMGVNCSLYPARCRGEGD